MLACRFVALATCMLVPDLTPRPWLERVAGHHNFDPTRDPGQLLTCLGLVGFDGCEYESSLVAAQRAWQRARDPEDPAFGFFRDYAALFVAFIGDEGDCSIRPQHAELLQDVPPSPLWNTDEPTSAACCNAGISCEDTAEGRVCSAALEPAWTRSWTGGCFEVVCETYPGLGPHERG
ncbi:MAG: hypothetical protein AAF799_45630 [Myxococcota bacterium]